MPKPADRASWRSALTEVFARLQRDHPPPERTRLSAEEEWQCRILGGSLLAWLERHGPQLLQERKFLRTEFTAGEEPAIKAEPLIVFLSNDPGRVAAQEILDPRPARIFYLSPAAFGSFLKICPDPDFCWHVAYSSTFTTRLDPDAQRQAAASHPLRAGERYWVHQESSVLGPRFGRGGDHLWKWDGQKPILLEEGFSSWIS